MRQNAWERRITEFLSCQGRNSHVIRDTRIDVSTSFADIQCIAALILKQINNVWSCFAGHWFLYSDCGSHLVAQWPHFCIIFYTFFTLLLFLPQICSVLEGWKQFLRYSCRSIFLCTLLLIFKWGLLMHHCIDKNRYYLLVLPGHIYLTLKIILDEKYCPYSTSKPWDLHLLLHDLILRVNPDNFCLFNDIEKLED